jgi:hypothetical protein
VQCTGLLGTQPTDEYVTARIPARRCFQRPSSAQPRGPPVS